MLTTKIKDEVEELLIKIKNTDDNHFIIDYNRNINRETFRNYNLYKYDVIKIVKDLNVKKFIKRIRCANSIYHAKYLFEFKEEVVISDKVVNIYIKLGIHNNNINVYIVSFHKDILKEEQYEIKS